MEKVKVVTCILRKDGKILITKRGMRVGSFRGHWHGVSGFLEKNEKPLERAYTEIREETGIKKGSLRLAKMSKPLKVKSTDLKKELLIHAFLFDCSTKAIRLNWENVAYRWIYPSRLGDYRTVPKLENVLKAVLE